MKIVYIADPAKTVVQKTTPTQRRVERCSLMIANQTFEDKKSAEKLFADRLQTIDTKKQKLGI
ncbi:MAG TPA: hypothetical protein VF679_01630 [Pedobacter sp.]|jgi:hypothetical protein